MVDGPEIRTMKTEKALLITRGMMVAGVLLAIVTIVGELLGWWNDLGEMMLGLATVLGTLGGVASVIIGSSSEEVRRVHDAVKGNGSVLGSVDGKLDSVDGKLESVDGKLDSVDGKLDELDVIQAELDQQTGVLGEQVGLLRQIRDRL